MENTKTNITRNMWFLIILFGLIGQIAWAVENMYFNLFVYNRIARSTATVTLMVQLSGVTATVVTLFAGIFSDKLSNRRHFITIGYIIWGIVVLSFAFITKENIQKIFNLTDAGKIVSVTLCVVIVMDCVMTLFGSTANDAAFNAWITDNTDPSNRGSVEGILSIMPLFALLIVAGGFGILVSQIDYDGMFIALGLLITGCGIVGLFTFKDAQTLQKSDATFIKDLLYGFKPSTIKQNATLYIILVAMCIFSIACQVFMPYLIIYLQEYLKFSVTEYSIVLGSVVLLGATVVVFVSRASDKLRKDNMLYIFTAIFAIGLIAIFFVNTSSHTLNLILLGIFGFIMIVGYISLLSLLGALTRDYTPEENAGKLQGIRMIFYILIPMFVGPAIGQAINESQGQTFINPDTKQVENVPAPGIFLAAGLIAILIFVPLVFLTLKINQERQQTLLKMNNNEEVAQN